MSVNRPMLSKGSALVRFIVTMYCGICEYPLSYPEVFSYPNG
jgi:hypothetical protein